jgi:hypothetical protein
VVSVEESCHGVEQIFIFMQIGFTLNLVELELTANVFILKRRVPVYVLNELGKKVS